MFFRRERPKVPTFQERIAALKPRGFTVTQRPDGGVRIQREPCAVDARERDGGVEWQGTAGIVTGAGIASLVDGGYQKFFRAPGGRKMPATAQQLVDLHNFEEDLRDALGLKALYNEALGTVSTFYQYDRVQDRDRGVPKRAWE